MARQRREVVVVRRGSSWEALGFVLILAAIVMGVMCTKEAGGYNLSGEAFIVGFVGIVVFIVGRFK